jgi:hypothetical protein
VTPQPFRRSAPAWSLIGGAALLQAALHAASVGRYGIFRDELYYLSCASRPAAGYVDQPAFSILFLGAWRAVFGDSAWALMVPPALCGVAVVVLTGLLARRFGGGSAAQGLAAAAAAVAPIWVGMTGYYSMNSFDILFWTLAATILAALLGDEPGPRTGRLWLTLGLVLALGLLNKISVLWLGFGIFAGLALTPARRWLTTLGPWLAGGIAFLGLLPYLAWNALHRWPTLEFMRRATGEKYRATSPLAFGGELLFLFQPLAAPLWIAGLVWLLAARDGRRFRLLGVAFVATFAILLANRTSKAEYLAASFAPLLAAGGVALERVLHRGRSAAPAWVYGAVLVAGGVALAPLAIPLLPVPRYLAYSKALGVAPSTSERKAIGVLPQHFADRFGWPEMAGTIASVFGSLPEADRRRTAVYAYNYGEAGAVDFFGRTLGLPPAICPHNNYFLWGLRGQTPDVFLVFGGPRSGLERVFSSVEEGAVFTHPWVMPYESGRTVWICRGLKIPFEEIWPAEKNFS